MRGISTSNLLALAEKFDFPRFRTLCVVGGATGLLCTLVARRYPHIDCVSFDLPAVEPIAQRWIAREADVERVRTASGDFLKEPLAKADVITMADRIRRCVRFHRRGFLGLVSRGRIQAP
jgi:hypothetical protein